MEKVKDQVGFARKQWSQWFSQFNRHFKNRGLLMDLNQTIETVGLEITDHSMANSSRHIQKEFRNFLKTNGFSKVKGKWVLREFQFSPEVWRIFEKTSLIKLRDWD